ncbi:MAG: LysM peptidoglycan-binding domain-containing protein [Chloroflexi bacterium]|nr:LysM peptidoglycan-binding domain-containing protein [Chloroflexota bacterium]
MRLALNRRHLRGLLFLALILMMVAVSGPLHKANAQGNTITHVVQPGENLFRISLRYGVSVQDIVVANNIANPNVIYVGQVLIIPVRGTTPPTQPPPTNPTPAPPTNPTPAPPTTGTTYTVQRGDTLSAIARRFGVTVQAIASANNIANPNLIYPGQVLNIPGATTPSNPATPVPTQPSTNPTQPPTNPTQPPVVPPSTGGAFELGGHVAGFGRVNEMRTAGMTWAKKQIRWNLGENTGSAQAAINEARGNGFRVLLSIVGNKDQMGDFENYTNQFAAYLGQVAALGPDAIEVWNEPNIDREWPNGTVNGGRYTTMLSKAYNAIKAANANVMVISAAPAPTGYFGGGCRNEGCDDNIFIQQMAQAGAVNYMDCVGAHYNEGIISPDNRSGDPRGGHYSRYFFGMLDLYYNTFGGARKICWTELGYLSPEGYGTLPSNFSWAQATTAGQMAEWLGRAAALSRSSGRVRLMVVWNVDFTGVFGADPQGGYSIVRPDGSCPACGTLGAAMR